VPLVDPAEGRGGSATSESVRRGMGASTGGSAVLLMASKRPPGVAGAMKFGVLSPMFMHLFTAKQNKCCAENSLRTESVLCAK
jgi:hypothetical protein